MDDNNIKVKAKTVLKGGKKGSERSMRQKLLPERRGQKIQEMELHGRLFLKEKSLCREGHPNRLF
jgi:hypothetical protein